MHNEEESLTRSISKKLIRDKLKGVAKKGAKALAKMAMKATIGACKAIFGYLAGLFLPFFGSLIGIIIALICIIVAIVNLFSSPDLPPELAKLRTYIEQKVESSIDQSKPEQLPYRVPTDLIFSALTLYDHTNSPYKMKDVIDMLVAAFTPIFSYIELEEKTEIEITTCETIDGETTCTEKKEVHPYTRKVLQHVEAWNRTVDITYQPYITEWEEKVEEKTEWRTRNKLNEYGEPLPHDWEVYEVNVKTITRHRTHTHIDHKVENEDYTFYQRVLSSPPFEYGQNDIVMIEALFQSTGQQIRYSEWLKGNSLIGFDGTITPGAGVPTEYMQYYLEAEKIYKVDWYYLAALHYVETGFSTHPTMISSAGAEGHLQFMPCTWLGWNYPGCNGSNGYVDIPESIKYNPLKIKQYGGYGIDADGNGKASTFEIKDAIFTAASYLNKNGYSQNREKAIYAYNHAEWYVEKVNQAAEKFRAEAVYSPKNGDIPPLAPGSFMKPAVGNISSGYGWRNLGSGMEFHHGIDIANSAGTPIVSVADGVVKTVAGGCNPVGSLYDGCNGGYGNYIIVQHTVNGVKYESLYAHLQSITVRPNQKVTQGQLIGLMGNSGRSTGPHLHFELHSPSKDAYKNVLNPSLYLPL